MYLLSCIYIYKHKFLIGGFNGDESHGTISKESPKKHIQEQNTKQLPLKQLN